MLRDIVGDTDGVFDFLGANDWRTAGPTGRFALDFNSAGASQSELVYLPNSDQWSGKQGAVSVWAKSNIFDSARYKSPLGRNLSGNLAGDMLFLYNPNVNAMRFGIQDGTNTSTVDANEPFLRTEWTHYLGVWDESRLEFFINGVSQGTAAGIELVPHVSGTRIAIGHSGYAFNDPNENWEGSVSDVRWYSRSLNASEAIDLYQASRTGYQDQFKRRYFPVSTTVEEPPTEETTGGLIRLKSPKQSEPSYKAGYAKSASESAYPELWDGLHRAWVPSLGATNDLIDVASNSNATLNSPSARPIWNPTNVQTTGNGDETRFNVPSIGYTGIATIYIRVKINSDTGEVARLFEFDSDNRIYVTSTLSAKISGSSLANYTYPVGEWLDLFIQPIGTDILFFINDDTNHSTSNRTWTTLSPGAFLNAEFATTRAPDCELESVCFWKRQLSQNEMRSIRKDPLAPFRQRRYAPVSLPTEEPLTLLEKIRSVAKPTTTRALSLKKNSVPSYKAGYAKSASESAHPELWDGLKIAYSPQLGNRGDVYQLDVVSGNILTKKKVGTSVTEVVGERGIVTQMSNAKSLSEPIDWSALGFTDGGFSYFMELNPTVVPPNPSVPLSVEYVSSGNVGFFQSFFLSGFTFRILGNNNTSWIGRKTTFGQTTGWKNIACTWGGEGSSSDIAIYFDAVRKDTSDEQIGTFDTAQTTPKGLSIGAQGLAGQLNVPLSGEYGTILLYNRALSPSEIALLNADPLAPFRKKTLTIGYQPSKELRGLFRT